ncbi:cytochrome P450 [Tengunoibacter tsumagoiensis]|uniref:Cytochrome P450 n=1 Tax=Tengunoibacter tsumagoiensis TaxID=2014871 RepID=A0A402A1D2_9CHLR|nr:cytochrome P450 [Tengunoibacter tsumagoiensis]GCE12866.1 cytochrome P450 [Tengunoibacter tsumagoiensis]
MQKISSPNLSPKSVPGPQSPFFRGHLREMQQDQLGLMLRLRERYGDLVRFRAFGSVFLYVCFDPQGIDHILRVNAQNYHKGSSLQRLTPLLGRENLFLQEGASWLRERRLAQPAFHRQRIAGLTTMMTDSALAMLQRWQAYEQHQQAFDLSTEMMRLTLHIVTKALFNVDVEVEASAVGQAFNIALEHLNHDLNALVPFPLWIPTASNREYTRALTLLNTVVARIIQERRGSQEDRGDLLSMFLLARDEETGEFMNDQQLRDEVMTMVFAGHETTANALTWAWYLLAEHPQVEQRLQQELSQVLGGRVPTVADLPLLPYTRMILDETLRLYPPAPGVIRHVLDDDEIAGYHIPKGSEIAMYQYVTHRHPDLWEQPDQFDPERFLPERSAGRPRFAYFPFGGGPRMCIGNSFALTEAQLILATVAQTYEVRVVPEPLVTLRPRNGMQVTLQRRR